MREAEEKQRRAREAREKAEAERLVRAERKRALVDMNAHETQEGVMDSLMEALQTGSAFSRPINRKRQTRAAGGKFQLISKGRILSLKYAKKVRNLESSNYNQANDDELAKSEEMKLRFGFNSVNREVPGVESNVEKSRNSSVKKRFSFQNKNDCIQSNVKILQSEKSVNYRHIKIIMGKKRKRNSFVRQVNVKRRKRIASKIKNPKSTQYLKIRLNSRKQLIAFSNFQENNYSFFFNNQNSVKNIQISPSSQLAKNNLNNNRELNQNLEDNINKFDGMSFSDTIFSTSNESFIKKSRKLKELFTFRNRKLLDQSLKESENSKITANWKIWKSRKNSGKIEITPKTSYK